MLMGIDTGNRPKPVYDFAARHPQCAYNPTTGVKLHAIRTVLPVKGTDDNLRILASMGKEDAVRQRQGIRILSVGTHAAKQEIFDSLRSIRPSPDGKTLSGNVVPACYHHPEYDMNYFLSLTAEARVVENGKVKYEKRRDRNEALDIAVYNRAMAAVVGIDRFTPEQWEEMERALAKAPDTSATLSSAQPSPVDAERPAVIQSESTSVHATYGAAPTPPSLYSGARDAAPTASPAPDPSRSSASAHASTHTSIRPQRPAPRRFSGF
jgi:phage terminase large subunit GpA-like protein